jgi:hypothetical protein
MAKINTYETSSPVLPNDRWIGTDSGNSTKNFVASDVADYVKSTNTIDTNVILGNNTGVEAVPKQLLPAEVAAMLPVFTTSAKGLVPTGTMALNSFLKSDGTWAIPPSTGGTTTNSLVIKANSGTTEGNNMYTFDGGAAKALNILPGANINMASATGQLLISSNNEVDDTNAVGPSGSPYTLVLKNQILIVGGTGATFTVNIPDNGSVNFPKGSRITIWNYLNSGASGTVTLNAPPSAYFRGGVTNTSPSATIATNRSVTIVKLNDFNVWGLM